MQMKLWLFVAAASIAVMPFPTSAQDAEAGRIVFNKCLPCHAVGVSAVNKVGPILNGLDGRKAGTVEKYSYSDANKSSGIVWSEVEFKDYIRAPRAKIPNTKMIFPGITNQKDVDNLWSYLAQFNADGSKK
jgi:cytochrome c